MRLITQTAAGYLSSGNRPMATFFINASAFAKVLLAVTDLMFFVAVSFSLF